MAGLLGGFSLFFGFDIPRGPLKHWTDLAKKSCFILGTKELWLRSLILSLYMHTYMYLCMYIYIYHIGRERER